MYIYIFITIINKYKNQYKIMHSLPLAICLVPIMYFYVLVFVYF